MKKILVLSLVLLSMQVTAEDITNRVELELDVFGLSYHSNRDYDFNEVNPGLGVSVVLRADKPDDGDHWSMVFSTGTYKDSYCNQAFYVLGGPRYTLGYDDSFHVSAALQIGFLDGSGKKGAAYVPFLAVGYDWFNVGITGDPVGEGEKGKVDSSKMVAIFLKFRVLDF